MCENSLVVKHKKTAFITDILNELLVCKLSNMSLSITDPEDSLPLAKQHAIGPCPEPDKSRQQINNLRLLTLFQCCHLSTTMSIRLTVYHFLPTRYKRFSFSHKIRSLVCPAISSYLI